MTYCPWGGLLAPLSHAPRPKCTRILSQWLLNLHEMPLPRIKHARIGSLQCHDFQAPFIGTLYSSVVRTARRHTGCLHLRYFRDHLHLDKIHRKQSLVGRVDINTLDSRPEAHAESGEVESETTTDSVTQDSWLYISRLVAPIVDSSETIVARHFGADETK